MLGMSIRYCSADLYNTYIMYHLPDVHWHLLNDTMSPYYLCHYRIFLLNALAIWVFMNLISSGVQAAYLIFARAVCNSTSSGVFVFCLTFSLRITTVVTWCQSAFPIAACWPWTVIHDINWVLPLTLSKFLGVIQTHRNLFLNTQMLWAQARTDGDRLQEFQQSTSKYRRWIETLWEGS